MYTVKGRDLAVGMRVRRRTSGGGRSIETVVFAEGPYFRNPLYSEDDFEVFHDTPEGKAHE